MKIGQCSVDGCENIGRLSKGMCNAHYLRLSRYGRLHSVRRDYGSGTIKTEGYLEVVKDKVKEYAHRTKAAKALGRPLPPGAEVHHANRNKLDNSAGNLVICPDHAYHALLHAREDLLKFINEGGDSGVYFGERVKQGQRPWYARINYDKRNISLGSFGTKEEAIEARKAAAKIVLFGDPSSIKPVRNKKRRSTFVVACACCGTEFVAKTKRTTTCSRSCATRHGHIARKANKSA